PTIRKGGTTRWEPDNDEIRELQSYLKEPSSSGLKNPDDPIGAGPKIRKVLESLRKGPIPQTEDVPKLLRRGKNGRSESLAVGMPPAGWFPYSPKFETGEAAALGALVEQFVLARYLADHPSSTVVENVTVYTPTTTRDLKEFKDKASDGNREEFRLRIIW